jgi:hypothetical protein
MGRIIAPLPNPFIGDGVDPGCCGAQPTQPKEVFMLSFIVLVPVKTPKGLICVVGIVFVVYNIYDIISMILYFYITTLTKYSFF